MDSHATTPRFLPGPAGWRRFWSRAEAVPAGHFVRTAAAARAIVGRADAVDYWHLAPPEHASDPRKRFHGAGWRRTRLRFAVLTRTLRARARRLQLRIEAALGRLRGAAPYLALAAALLAGSVLGSLYAPLAEDVAAPPQRGGSSGNGGSAPRSLPDDPQRAGYDPGRSPQVSGVSAVALAALEPDRIAGTVRAPLPRASATRPVAPAPSTVVPQAPARPVSGAGLPQERSLSPLTRDDLHEIIYQLGYSLQLQGAADQAVAIYQRAVELDPHHAATLYNWGYILQQRGEVEAAMAKYREAIEVDPEHFYAHYNLGWLLQKRGETDAAIDRYQRAAALDSTNPYVYYNWGYILEARGEIAEALRLYARALEIAPDRRPGTDAQERIAALHFGRGQRLASH